MLQYVVGVLLIAVVATAFSYASYRTSLTTEPMSSKGEFGGVSLRIEYATTSATRERGFSGRENIASDEAMLFVFPKDDLYGFWMKDTLIPLDIFWLDSKGHVVSFAPDIATSTYPNVFYPSVPVKYVLETYAGFAREHGIAIGTPLLLKDFPSVSQ